jgi:hypothetical protein
MDPNSSREAWHRFQSALQRAHQQSGAGKAPKGAIGGGIAAVLLAGTFFTVNSALFNGKLTVSFPDIF